MIEEIKKKARELLKNKQVDLLIGYKRAADKISATPCFITQEEQADALIWDAYCVYNLTNYLREFPGQKKAIVTKPCDAKSITVLLQENQLKRDELCIIGLGCSGVIDQKRGLAFDEKCKGCKTPAPGFYDLFIEDNAKRDKPANPDDYDEYGSIRKSEAKSLLQRLKFWEEEFSRCIRCYACRQVCPMCYCPKCVAEQTMPAWFSKAASLKGNFSWNVTRAMHLAGRCTGCGECERACPVGIPLREINKKIEKDIKELFNYEAGLNAEQKPLLSCFDKNDPDEWIK